MSTRRIAGFVLLFASTSLAQTPLGTAFTYQGLLKSGGSPASGSYTMVFKLFDASGAGSQVGPTLTFDGAGGNPPQVAVANGLFTVQLDFGSVFSGNKRWLEITVSATTLAPRQELTAAPNALFAMNADLLDGLSSSAFLQSVPVPLFLTGTANYVIEGENSSSSNFTAGVRGDSTSPTGGTIGVYGSASSTGGSGVFGIATAVTGSTIGVAGQSNSSSGTGVTGSGAAYGVDGQSTSTSGTGVRGTAGAGSGTTYGVYGQNISTSGRAVYGIARGVYGVSNSTSGLGTVGYATAVTGTTYGIYGQSDSPSGYGGYFNGRGYFSGNVGIGTTAPTTSLDVRGSFTLDPGTSPGLYTGTGAAELNRYLLLINSSQLQSASGLKAGGLLVSDDYFYANPGKTDLIVKGRIGIGTAAPSQALHVVGNIQASGSVFASCGTLSCSDERFKKNVVPLGDALGVVEKLRPVRFDWKGDQFPKQQFSKDGQIGLIAQEVQKVVPEVVQKGSDGYLAIDYGRLTPILVEAIKQVKCEKDAQIAELTARLEGENARLRSELDDLKRAVSEIRGSAAKENVRDE